MESFGMLAIQMPAKMTRNCIAETLLTMTATTDSTGLFTIQTVKVRLLACKCMRYKTSIFADLPLNLL